MELKEIKCKNCDAKLKIKPNDKMITCEYCKTTFSIDDDYSKSYNTVKGALDAQRDSVPKTSKIMFIIIFAIIFSVTILIMGISIFSFVKGSSFIGSKILDSINYDDQYYEQYAGTTMGSSVYYVIDEINTNNKKNDFKITVIYNDITAINETDLLKIKDMIDEWTDYEVTYDYNDDNHIYQMHIIDK